MKRSLILLAFFLAVLVMAAAGVVIGRRVCPPGCGAAGHADEARVEQVDWLTHTLELTPQQQAAVERIEEQYRGALATQCAAHCAAKARLQEVLFAPATDPAAAEPLLDAMAAAQRACERATLDHIRQVHGLLTPTQRALFEAAVRGSVCGCRTGLHGCQDAGNGSPAGKTDSGCDLGSVEKRP